MFIRLKNKRGKGVSQDWFAAEIMAKLTKRDRDIDRERQRERDKLFKKLFACTSVRIRRQGMRYKILVSIFQV